MVLSQSVYYSFQEASCIATYYWDFCESLFFFVFFGVYIKSAEMSSVALIDMTVYLVYLSLGAHIL